MNEIKAIIADDEEQLRHYLKSKLTEVWPELNICGEAENGPEAVELINKHKPDVAFLDINMPGFSGLKVAEKIEGAVQVVFITAYDQYAVEAFENEAIDYILKPVQQKRLEKTIKRIKSKITAGNAVPGDMSEILKKLAENLSRDKTDNYLQWIRAQHGQNIRLIPIDEVSLLKASDKYTIVISKSGQSLIRKTIKELENELDPKIFWKISRSAIINASAITKISRSLTGRYIVKLNNYDEPITVSRAYSHLFKQM